MRNVSFPRSPGAAPEKAGGSDSEEDPLDAFMANLEKDAKEKATKSVSATASKKDEGVKSAHPTTSKSSKGWDRFRSLSLAVHP